MTPIQSDALVFFGATGDLAYKKIFPALQALAKRGQLDVPVIGVAKAGWNLDQLRARALDSVEKHGGLDREAFTRLSAQLHYVDGDYKDPATFAAVRAELGAAKHPAHYLAIPPPLFGPVVEQLAHSGCANGARVVVEKPFGEDLATARALNQILLSAFVEQDIFRIDHYLGKRRVHFGVGPAVVVHEYEDRGFAARLSRFNNAAHGAPRAQVAAASRRVDSSATCKNRFVSVCFASTGEWGRIGGEVKYGSASDE